MTDANILRNYYLFINVSLSPLRPPLDHYDKIIMAKTGYRGRSKKKKHTEKKSRENTMQWFVKFIVVVINTKI